MNDETRTTLNDDSEIELQPEILIGRMIDGEASDEDERAFERLAESRPELWRELALRQRDSAALMIAVERRLSLADSIELPIERSRLVGAAPANGHAHRTPAVWLLASAGWAAALLIAAMWSIGLDRAMEAPHAMAVRTAEHVTPDEQLRSYLRAPYVLGELDPLMLEAEPLPDGRIALVALRRIQEVIFLDGDDPLPVDEERHFTRDPAELRGVVR